MPHISIVTPVYEAEKIVPELYRRLTETLGAITDDYEIVMVEDCSSDASWPVIVGLAARDARVKGIKLEGATISGSTLLSTAGLDYANGDWVVVMDCDLQDPPGGNPKALQPGSRRCDIVIGRRAQRQDSFVAKARSKVFYRAFSYLSGTRNRGEAANFRILCCGS